MTIINKSNKIPRSRKIKILTVYLDQLDLVFCENPTNKPPSEIQEAKNLYAEIKKCLNRLTEEAENTSQLD